MENIKLDPRSRDEIIRFGGDMGELCGVAPGGRLGPIVASLGGRIVYQDLDDYLESAGRAVTVSGPGRFVLRLAKFTGPLTDRLTIARAIWSYVVHSECGQNPINVPRSGGGLVRTQSYWFAAGFLMPEGDCRAAMTVFGEDGISEIANYFLVPTAAARARCRTLGWTQKRI